MADAETGPAQASTTRMSVRRTVASDIPVLEKWIGSDSFLVQSWFGSSHSRTEKTSASLIAEHLESCFVSVVAMQQQSGTAEGASRRRAPQETPLALLCLSEYPENSSLGIDPTSWTTYVGEKYGLTQVRSVSSLWVRMFYIDTTADHDLHSELSEAVAMLLDSVFSSFPEIDDLLCALPRNGGQSAVTELLVKRFFDYVPPSDPTEGLDLPAIMFHCRRDSRIRTLSIRIGRVEDHDDLLPFVQGQGQALIAQYGEYYLAELLEHQDEKNRTLVAEVDGVGPVGVLRLSAEDFDQEILSSCFQLGPYNNLLKKGRVNAFRIQLFGMAEEYESRVMDFFPKAFDVFPDLDYCVMTVPFAMTAEDQDLLTQQLFQAIPPRPGSVFPNALFILNRYSLLKDDLCVRKATIADLPAIQKLCAGLPLQKKIVEATREHVNNSDSFKTSVCLTLQCANQTVGSLIMNSDCQAKDLRAHFDTDAFVPFDVHDERQHCELSYFVIDPIFSRRSRFFVREALRLFRKSVLYAKVSDLDHFNFAVNDAMVPVPPRRMIESPNELAQDHSDSMPFVLFCTRRKLLSEPIRFNHTRIVVVGASDTGLSFLHNLMMIPDLRFSNLTLISPLGLPAAPSLGTRDHDSAATFKPNNHTFTPSEYRRFFVPNGLRIVQDKLVDFYRDKKQVVLGGGSLVSYDYLVLATGQQYKLSRRVHPKEKAVPEGVFVLRDAEAELEFEEFIRDSFIDAQEEVDPIAVYGHGLDALCVVQSLLRLGIRPENIVLVTPRMNSSDHIQVGLFAEHLAKAIKETGIQYMPNHLLKTLVTEPGDEAEEEQLAAIMIQQDEEEERDDMTRAMEGEKQLDDPFELACSCLVYLHKTEVDDDILHAVNFRALVFDGRLILKPSFKTEDPFVLSINSVAKFSRRFGHSEPFELFNPREVATRATKLLLPEWEPTLFAADPVAEQFPPTFAQPLATSCVIPGGKFLFRAWSPAQLMKRAQQLKALKSMQAKGVSEEENLRMLGAQEKMKVIHTNVGGNFLQLFFDEIGTVQEIRYLGNLPPLASNWFSMIGLPERYLHNIVARFDEGIIPNLVDFLNENWARAVFHDRFSEFRSLLLKMFRSQDDIQTLEARMRTVLENRRLGLSLQFSEGELLDFLTSVDPETKRALERECIHFLKLNEEVLRVYFLPLLPVQKP